MHNAVSEQLVPKHDTGDALPGGSLGTILIIDDEAAIRESLETLLELEGYRIVTAENGEDGLSRIAERPFDLILLDFALPDRNGLEILADIRDRDPNLAVIMITESCGSCAWMSARTSMPLRSGSARSSRIKSNGRSPIRAKPSRPVEAASTS